MNVGTPDWWVHSQLDLMHCLLKEEGVWSVLMYYLGMVLETSIIKMIFFFIQFAQVEHIYKFDWVEPFLFF